jgi:hypothetical protein
MIKKRQGGLQNCAGLIRCKGTDPKIVGTHRGVATGITITEPCFDMSQIGRSDRSIAGRADRVRRGRPIIHPYEPHVTSPNSRQRASGSLFATELSGRAATNQPSAIAIPAGLEAIRAPPRAEGSSPGIVSDQTKPSAADGATLWSTIPRLLRVAAHCGLLFGLPQVVVVAVA